MPQTGTRLKPQPLYIVSDEHRFVYFIVQKAACSSIKTALLPFFDLDTAPYERTLRDGSRILKIHGIFDGSEYQIRRARFVKRLDEGRYRDYFKFAFVRNPWDRLVSCHLNKFRENGPGLKIPDDVDVKLHVGMSFAEFVEAVHALPDESSNPHFRSQHTVFCPRGDGVVLADFVGRFENLSEDFDVAMRQIGVEGEIQLPHILRNKSREGRSYHEFYDDRLRKLVHERFSDDIEIFGYSF